MVVGVLLLGNALAQQAAPKSNPTPAGKTRRTPAKAPAAKAGQAPAKATMELKTQKQKVSYAIGVKIGRDMRNDSADIDPDVLAQGLKDALSGSKLLLTDEEAGAAISALQGELQQKHAAKMQAAGEINRKAGQEFLAANKAKPGVVTLPSGLQYRILKEGTGAKPTAQDTVVCNYKGTLTDGTEFDSSYKRGEPASFPVNRVIKGWTEALQLMTVGSQWELVIPSELAYGERGAGDVIGPNSTLVFEVELISIQGKEQTAK